MEIINLSRSFKPAGEFDLIRLGRDCDGGYVVDSRDVAEADVLISLGVNDDWSFDQDFLEYREVPLHAFDATVGRGVLTMKMLKALAFRQHIKHKFKSWREYGTFFSGNRHHHAKMVGLHGTPGFLTLRDILATYAPHGRVFLKVDIEGWEYRILDDVLAAADRICGLAIEFHDVDLHHARLEEFISKLPLSVAHVHRNSYAPISDEGIPLVLEFTFSSHTPVTADAVKLPHPLDRLSAPHHEPWEINFVS